MSNKTLKWIIYIIGTFCFFIWLSVRIEPLFNAMLKEKIIAEYWENTRWGELYYFNFIKDFREKDLPPAHVKYRFTDRHPTIDKADILLFGDSYFDFTRMTTFPEQLSDSLNKKIHYVRYDKPLEYLDKINYTNSEPKILLYETAERFFHNRFVSEQPESYQPDNHSLARKTFDAVNDFIFQRNTEIVLDQFLCRSYLTYNIHSIINTLKFKTYGYISEQTPVYTTRYDGVPWLFVSTEVSTDPHGFYYKPTEKEIRSYCDHIQSLSDHLKDKYNLYLYFMIIPSKYTIYCDVVDSTRSNYGNLIPELYQELGRRGIPVIKIYEEYLAEHAEKLLYYGTDTHWTEEGLQIALTKTIKQLQTFQPMKYQAQVHPSGNNSNQFNGR